MNFKHQ